MEHACAILDEDERYAARLANAVNARRGISFAVRLFTNEEAMMVYLNDNQADVIVVDEQMLTDRIMSADFGRMIILTQNDVKNSEADDKIQKVYRYQAADRLVTSILGENYGLGNRGTDNTSITGIYSPIHYAGRTSLALAVASAYSKSGRRALYINFEEFSGLSELLPESDNGNLSDAIYYYRNKGADMEKKIAQIICKCGQIEYIPPVRCAEDIAYVDTVEWVEFIRWIAELSGFDVIVLDISNAVSSPWRMLEVCGRVFMPVREEYIAGMKINDFETYLLGIGKERLLDIIEKILLPKDKNLELGTDFFDRIEYGILGKYAKELI